jgi:hypothetical protein
MHKCTSTMSEDGGSGSPRVPCSGFFDPDTGEHDPGCCEPCGFAMMKLGYGEPPWTEADRNLPK